MSMALLAKSIWLSGITFLMPGHCLAERLQGSDHNICMRGRTGVSLRHAGGQGNAAQEARKACLDVMLLAVEEEEPGSALQAADLLKQVTAYTGYPAQHGLHHRIRMLRHNGLTPNHVHWRSCPQHTGSWSLAAEAAASMAAPLVLCPGLWLW